MKYLFEVKSDISTSSVYTAIGQLMFHGARQLKPPVRVIVLPDIPNEASIAVFQRLKIKCVSYDWVGEEPSFSGLESLF